MEYDYFARLLGAFIMGLAALVHLVRLFVPFDFIVGSWHVPKWASIVAVIIGGYVSFFLFLSIL